MLKVKAASAFQQEVSRAHFQLVRRRAISDPTRVHWSPTRYVQMWQAGRPAQSHSVFDRHLGQPHQIRCKCQRQTNGPDGSTCARSTLSSSLSRPPIRSSRLISGANVVLLDGPSLSQRERSLRGPVWYAYSPCRRQWS
jgi:hypothetical protein